MDYQSTLSQNTNTVHKLHTNSSPTNCCCCLSEVKPVVNLQTCKHTVILQEIYKMDLPLLSVCLFCHSKLVKIQMFQNQVRESCMVLKKQIPCTMTKLNNLQQSQTTTFTLPNPETETDTETETVKIELDLDDENMPFDFATKIKFENDSSSSDFENDLALSEVEKTTEPKPKKQKITPTDDKYKGKNIVCNLNREDLEEERDRESKKESYIKLPFRCESCVIGFDHENTLKNHIDKQHSKFKMAPQTGSATPEQIETLLNFLDEHRDLARGRLRGSDGSAHAKRLWEELCNMLNSMGGCTKSVQQWQKVWFDRKHLAKKAAADSRRSASATGGGPSTAPQLSQWQLKILSIMGEGFGERQTSARVPAFGETNEPIPSSSSQTSQPPRFSQPLSLDMHEEVVSHEPSQEDRQLLQPDSQAAYIPSPVTQESRSSTLSSQPTRRRRQSAAVSDIRSRLFQYEEGRAQSEAVRNTELAGIRTEVAGIRATLMQLCELLKEYLDRN